MLNEKIVARIREQYAHDEHIELLCNFYDEVTKSPFYEGYLGVLTSITNLNQELREGKIKIASQTEIVKTEEGSVKLQDANDKAFERGHKYLMTMGDIYAQLEFLRGHITPQQAEDAKTATTLQDEVRQERKQNAIRAQS